MGIFTDGSSWKQLTQLEKKIIMFFTAFMFEDICLKSVLTLITSPNWDGALYTKANG